MAVDLDALSLQRHARGRNDQSASAGAAIANETGFPDRTPVLPALAMADGFAGLWGAAATLTALRAVEVGGAPGQVIDLSLIEPILAMLARRRQSTC